MVKNGIGSILLMAALVAIAIVVMPQASKPVTLARDTDAQSFVDALEEAEATEGISNTNRELYSAASYGDSGAFFFLRKGETNPVGALFYYDRGIANVTEVHWAGSQRRPYLRSLDDLRLGPSRALRVVQAAYPAFNVYTVALFRDESSYLFWRVAGTLDEEGKPSQLLVAEVRNPDGALTLTDDTPRSYQSLFEIMTPN